MSTFAHGLGDDHSARLRAVRRPMKRTRIAIVDDMTVFRELVAPASTGEEALRVLGADLPDVLLLDVVLPDMSGLDLLERLGPRARRCRVLLVTVSERPGVVQQALRAGVHGMVTKGTPLREFRVALDTVVAGGNYYCPTTARILRELHVQPALAEDLTGRERQIVQLIARGLSSKEIAHQLGLSVKTVSNHRLHIMAKIGARNAAGVTRYAIDQGWVDGAS